jgi:hypothetical protein
MRKSTITVVALVLLAVAGLAPAAEEGWTFKLTPYLWAMGADGDVGIGPVNSPVDIDFADAVKDLELGGMLGVEACQGPWSVMGDAAYIGLEDEASTALGEVEVEFEQWVVQGAATYLVLDYDYEEDAFRLDIAESGVAIGVQFSL